MSETTKNKIFKYLPFIGMASYILLVQVIALLLAPPMDASDMRAVSDPQSVWNPIYYIIIVLGFTAFILLVIKLNLKWIIHATILFAVASTLYYVFFALFTMLSLDFTILVPFILSAALTILLYKFPEWYVINITGVLIGAGAGALFGISLGIIPAIILLVLLAIYDAISVYKTKHMIALAEGVMSIKVPILFIVPKSLDYSFIDQEEPEKEIESDIVERGAYYMGLGDAVIPTVLVVSSNVFIPHKGFIGLPALGAIIGCMFGYMVLARSVRKGKPQAGLPFLNTGTILGFIAGSLV
ncbi:MAG: presenilin family intramembrane aspartyl protease PSH [Methanosarcinales archaeon]